MELQKTIENLKKRGFAVTYCASAAEAADYLDRAIDHVSVGAGGSVTLRDMGMYEKLASHNEVFWHWYIPEGMTAEEVRARAESTDVYLTSVNAIAATGELINIDGMGNRVASTLYGHKKFYFVAGVNKIAEDYDSALWRARNVASPKNAQRLGKKTPCAIKADRCYDCKSPERICRGLVVHWEAIRDMACEVVLIGEDLGF